MNVAPFVRQMSDANDRIFKVIARLESHLDSKRWMLAGVEIGRIIELADGLAASGRHSVDAAWTDSVAELPDKTG